MQAIPPARRTGLALWVCHPLNTSRLAPSPPIPKQFLADSVVFRWQNQTSQTDLILTLPVALCLGIGIAVGHPVAGMIAAGGAVNTGFGQKHCIDGSYLLPMIFVTFGMTFSGIFAVLIGHEKLLLVPVAALWGFGYGMLSARPEGYGWVGQQCVITFLVASAFPASLNDALDRGLLLLLGGVLQLIFSSILLRHFSELRRDLFQLLRYLREELSALRAAIIEIAESAHRRRLLSSAMPYSLRLAVTIGISTEIYHRLHYPSGYWIPMTALLVLKPELTDTVSRAIARMLGTMCGAIAVSFFIAEVHPAPISLAAGTVLLAWLAYRFLNVNYALFTMAVTGYIVFLLALNEIPGSTLALRRTICTAIGGAIALGVRLVVISCRRCDWPRVVTKLRHATLPFLM